MEGRRKGKPGSRQLLPRIPFPHPTREAMEGRCWTEGDDVFLWKSSKVKLNIFWGTERLMQGQGLLILLWPALNPSWTSLAVPSLPWGHAAPQVLCNSPALHPGSPAEPTLLPPQNFSPGGASGNLWCMEAWSNARENAIGIKKLKGRQNTCFHNN